MKKMYLLYPCLLLLLCAITLACTLPAVSSLIHTVVLENQELMIVSNQCVCIFSFHIK